MSIINILTKREPKLGGVFTFDAVLEDNYEATAELTEYPVESGVRVADHRIIKPMRYSIVGAISNNPLKITSTDFIGGAASNVLPESAIIAAIAGASAGYLAGSDATRASSALEFLINLLRIGEPISVDAVDIQLKNMVVTKVSRTRDPENENALIFVAELQELISLNRLPQQNQPMQTQLRDGDPAKSSIAGLVKKGQKIGKEVDAAISQRVNQVVEYARSL